MKAHWTAQNGELVNDGQGALSKADMAEVMGHSAHPGKALARGHFGFAGHNDPVAFRNIPIEKL